MATTDFIAFQFGVERRQPDAALPDEGKEDARDRFHGAGIMTSNVAKGFSKSTFGRGNQ